MTTHFQYLCDKKRGLSKDGLLEDLLTTIEVMKSKGYIDADFDMEIPLYPGYMLKISTIEQD